MVLILNGVGGVFPSLLTPGWSMKGGLDAVNFIVNGSPDSQALVKMPM